MLIIGEEKGKIINKLSFSEKYYEYLESLIKLLDLSRIYNNNGEKLLDTQILLSNFIILFETKAKEKNTNEDNVFMYKQLRAVAKSITDGILWRETKYNRVYISMLSYAKGPGNIKDDISLTTNKIKRDYLIDNNIVIANDVSNQSRIGDYIVINNYNIINILEVKKGNKIRGIDYYTNHKTSKQSGKILDTFNSLHTYPIKNINARMSYLKKISENIEKSYKNGHSTNKLNKYTSIRIIYNPNLKNPNSAIKDTKAIKNSIKNKSNDELITVSNYDFYVNKNNRYSTAVIAPYSIFPFNSEICVYLMAGVLQITSFINITGIKKEFENDNWIIEEVNKDKNISDDDTNACNMFYENKVDMSLFKIRKNDGYFSYFTISELQLIAFEFKSYKDIIKIHNEYYNEAKKDKSSGSYLITFDSDKDIYL